MNPSEINTFVIVIKGDERSEYYYSQIKQSWESIGIKLNRYDAYTPDNYEQFGLIFKPSSASKYVAKKLVKEFTPSERAAFISHYSLWKKIYSESIQNALIIEHDAALKDAELFAREWDNQNGFDVKLFGQGASCYTITPRACKAIKNHIGKTGYIWGGPMGYIADMSGKVMPYKFDRSFERLGGEMGLPVAHIYNPSVGNTIDKYSNLPKKWQQHFEKQTLRVSKERWVFIGEENE